MSFPLSTARRRRILAVALPVLLLRALLPVGFMPVAVSGGLQMQLCPGEVAMGLAGHAHAGHPGHPQPAGEHHVPCLFAAGGPAAPLSGDIAVGTADPPASERALPVSRAPYPPSIYRVQSPRGPPAVSL